MKFRQAVFALTLLSITMSCSKDTEDDNSTSKATNVYVIGWEKNDGKNLAKIWKNDTATNLTNCTQ
ncbi:MULTISPECIES: hypothetical protein [Flavobacterium]|uniref:Uncharacterized protein n=1 Tax=Flavobacterium chungangense TaxID=554283 RepID=A0A6V6YZB4_9FLAO|nr:MULTISPECIES: hypothetical protein [Flavobacterium]CAD0004831.1 hypothetical protein FLACHUCJ7_02049 [Flavobacterium chungangense]